MNVVRVDISQQPPAVALADVARPQPGSGELLIRVCAAGLTMTELSWCPTLHTKTGAVREGAIPGHEFSGVIEALGIEGDDHTGLFQVGSQVYGMNDWYSDGAMAEYCVAPMGDVAAKPRNLSHEEAASVPIAALTAWQALFDHAGLKPGEWVLVHGGAGSVGGFAIQLARLRGARVATTVSRKNIEYVRALGAERVIDYHASRFEESAKDMDVVFDTVGGETLKRSWNVLKANGRIVTVASEASADDPRAQKAFFIVEPLQKQLVEIGGMLEAGKLRTTVDTVVPLSQAPAAYAGKVPRQGRGKLVVRMK